jgi:hypothetical protein
MRIRTHPNPAAVNAQSIAQETARMTKGQLTRKELRQQLDAMAYRNIALHANLKIQFKMLDASPAECQRLRSTLIPVPPLESDAVRIGKIMPGVLATIERRMKRQVTYCQ